LDESHRLTDLGFDSDRAEKSGRRDPWIECRGETASTDVPNKKFDNVRRGNLERLPRNAARQIGEVPPRKTNLSRSGGGNDRARAEGLGASPAAIEFGPQAIPTKDLVVAGHEDSMARLARSNSGADADMSRSNPDPRRGVPDRDAVHTNHKLCFVLLSAACLIQGYRPPTPHSFSA